MDELPAEVQKRIRDIFNSYDYNPELEWFDVFHLYPEGVAYPDGYYEMQFFKLVGYNQSEGTYRNLYSHDALLFDGMFDVKLVGIFADGSTIVRFGELVHLKDIGLQAPTIYKGVSHAT